MRVMRAIGVVGAVRVAEAIGVLRGVGAAGVMVCLVLPVVHQYWGVKIQKIFN